LLLFTTFGIIYIIQNIAKGSLFVSIISDILGITSRNSYAHKACRHGI